MIKYTQLHCLKEMEKLCMNYILYTYSMVMLMTKKKYILVKVEGINREKLKMHIIFYKGCCRWVSVHIILRRIPPIFSNENY